MKKFKLILATLVIMAATLATPARSSAQIKEDWMPENGFWEIITNKAVKKQAQVQLYNLDKHLIYEEHLTGIVIDVRKRQTCRALNKSLQAALLAWNENKHLLKDKGLVAGMIKPAHP
ncbi:MAG TPA: hypothetical protein VK543_02895 [Puia sp.]|nr:hypothetical protein [Puia sp.]